MNRQTVTMRNVHLHGALKEKFGGPFRMDVRTASEAFRALGCQLPNFGAEIARGTWLVVMGPAADNGIALMERSHLHFGLGKQDLHFVPVLEGSKSGGSGKAIAGVAIVVASLAAAVVTGGAALAGEASAEAAGFAATGSAVAASGGSGIAATSLIAGLSASTGVLGITWGQVALFGAGLLFAGLGQILSPHPTTVNPMPSYLFGGPANISNQGGAVPLVYGQMRVGSIVVSSGLEVAQDGPYYLGPTV